MHRKLILRHRAGITLIELMITLAIIGTLTAVIAGGVMQSLRQANVSTTKLIIGQVRGGLTVYRTNHRSWPDDLETAAAFMPDGEVPTDAWGNALVYERPGSDGSPYEIVSLGEDGMPGGEDFAADISSLNLDE